MLRNGATAPEFFRTNSGAPSILYYLFNGFHVSRPGIVDSDSSETYETVDPDPIGASRFTLIRFALSFYISHVNISDSVVSKGSFLHVQDCSIRLQ